MRRTAPAVELLVGCPLFLEAQSFSPWPAATSLGPAVNSASTDGCPFISKETNRC